MTDNSVWRMTDSITVKKEALDDAAGEVGGRFGLVALSRLRYPGG